MSAHAQAYGKGLISLQRLLDVLVFPFFRVAETVNLMPPVSEGPQSDEVEKLRDCRSLLMSDWAHMMRRALVGSLVVVDGVQRLILDVPNSKRPEMMRGFERAGIFKVLDVHFPWLNFNIIILS